MDATNYFKCGKVSNAAVQAHAAYLRSIHKKEPRIVVYRRPEIGGAWSGRYAVVGESFGGSVDVV